MKCVVERERVTRKCLDERQKPVSQQRGNVQCLRWFETREEWQFIPLELDFAVPFRTSMAVFGSLQTGQDIMSLSIYYYANIAVNLGLINWAAFDLKWSL